MDDVPVVSILLLGDAGVGKSTFLSRFTLGSAAQAQRKQQDLPILRDLDQPFPFNIRMYNRPYRFEFSDTASSSPHYSLLKPSVIVLCYDISEPSSLQNLKTRWKYEVETHFNYDEELPVIVLGLKRDVRVKEDYDGRVRQWDGDGESDDRAVLNGRSFVYPQEALRIAQEMRCDRYCECSALTGELCREVFEDIAKTAAMTTTEKGGKSAGTECTVM